MRFLIGRLAAYFLYGVLFACGVYAFQKECWIPFWGQVWVKKTKSYKKIATWFQRLYGSYIPLFTSYRHRLSKYLAINNVISAFVSVILALMALSIEKSWVSDQIRHIFECGAFVAILFLCIPPIVISFTQTSYNGGHPYYWFDLERDFIGVKAREQKRALLNEKRNSVIMTPDDFLHRYRNK